jgi:hypothetical protein
MWRGRKHGTGARLQVVVADEQEIWHELERKAISRLAAAQADLDALRHEIAHRQLPPTPGAGVSTDD